MHARLAVAAGLSCLLSILVVVGPAAALSCEQVSDARAFASSTAVFSGELIAYEQVGDPLTLGTAISTFRVEWVFKGKLAPEVKILSGGLDDTRPTPPGHFLIYASDLDSQERSDRIQGRINDLDQQLVQLQQPLHDAEARLRTTADAEARQQLQTAQEAAAANVGSQRKALEQQKAKYEEQLAAPALAGVTLDWPACGARLRPLPIPSSFGKGVEPRGDNTEAQPLPHSKSWFEGERRWSAVGAAIGLAALAIWGLKRTWRRAQSSGP